MRDEPIVSIHCLVYNHEPYLRQCLDGFVMQKTDFVFEAIVHDDCSTDGSVAIIHEYAEKYPEIIKPIYEIENQYSKIGFIGIEKLMHSCSHGKYTAYCEGDDYWTDPYKLQKQVDFLEQHQEYSMCFHSVNIEIGGRIKGNDVRSNGEKCFSTKQIIEGGGNFCSTCSVVNRSTLSNSYPLFREECQVGDYPLQILLSLRGKVHYMPEIMGTYRYMHQGSWGNSVRGKERMLNLLDNTEQWMTSLNNYTKNKYQSSISVAILKIAIEVYNDHYIDEKRMRLLLKKHKASLFKMTSKSRKFYSVVYMKFMYPRVYRIFKR